MRKIIEVVAVCPLLGGKPCISDGITYDILMHNGTARRCMLWDGDSVYDGVSPEEPCRLKRAINKALSDEMTDDEPTVVEVPWDTTKEGSKDNAKKTEVRTNDN